MKQINTFSDDRLNHYCAYCGGRTGTRDHVPSKVLLEKPYPENLPVVPACLECNNGFSFDEEYFACFLECVLSGTTEPEKLSRTRVSKILNRKPALKARLEKSKINVGGNVHFKFEEKRIENMLIKLAKGHYRFENSDNQVDEPNSVWFGAMGTMTDEDIDSFVRNVEQNKSPEIGSRATFTLALNNSGIPVSHWVEVQPNNYQYSVLSSNGSSIVKIIIWDYLACQIIWHDS